MNNYLKEIMREISMTNNGKLMLANVPAHLRKEVDKLIAEGVLRRATFVMFHDSIMVA